MVVQAAPEEIDVPHVRISVHGPKTLGEARFVTTKSGCNESWGAPHLARFSRDVGYHESQPNMPIGLQSTVVESCGIGNIHPWMDLNLHPIEEDTLHIRG